MEKTMEKIVALAKARGLFIRRIYGRSGKHWDYGILVLN